MHRATQVGSFWPIPSPRAYGHGPCTATPSSPETLARPCPHEEFQGPGASSVVPKRALSRTVIPTARSEVAVNGHHALNGSNSDRQHGFLI